MIKLTDCFFEEVYGLARLQEENNRSFLGKIIKYITSFDDSKTYSFSQIMRIFVSVYKTSKKQENWNSLSQDYFEGKSLDEFIEKVCVNNNNMKKSSRPIERSKIGLSERQSERLLYFVIVYSLVIEWERLKKRISYTGGHFSTMNDLKQVIKYWRRKITDDPR
ncbi:MAG: hypothetical protein SPJ55_08760 [Treponema sp.]|nr:hypothetical protein [Treponema sp.]